MPRTQHVSSFRYGFSSARAMGTNQNEATGLDVGHSWDFSARRGTKTAAVGGHQLKNISRKGAPVARQR